MKTITADDGSSVAIREGVLETRDARGALVFAFDPATGRMTLNAPGGIDLASEGAIRIRSAEAVEIEAPVARFSFGRILEVAKSAYRRVEGLFHTSAGRVRTEAETSHIVQAGRVRVQADEDVRIDGESINLG